MIEHPKPECKQHDISANLLHNLVIYELLTLNRNKVLPNTGFSSQDVWLLHLPSSPLAPLRPCPFRCCQFHKTQFRTPPSFASAVHLTEATNFPFSLKMLLNNFKASLSLSCRFSPN